MALQRPTVRRIRAAVVLHSTATLVGGQFLDDSAVAAMKWGAAETAGDATFVVLEDAAE